MVDHDDREKSGSVKGYRRRVKNHIPFYHILNPEYWILRGSSRNYSSSLIDFNLVFTVNRFVIENDFSLQSRLLNCSDYNTNPFNLTYPNLGHFRDMQKSQLYKGKITCDFFQFIFRRKNYPKSLCLFFWFALFPQLFN